MYKILIKIKSNVFIFACVLVLYVSFHQQVRLCALLCFLQEFYGLAAIFRWLQFLIIVVYDVKQGSTSFLYMWKSSHPSAICWRDCSFPVDWIWHPCKNQWAVDMDLFLEAQFYSIGLYVCPYTNFHSLFFTKYYNCYMFWNLEISVVHSFFFLRLFWDIQGSPLIPYKFEYWPIHFWKKSCWSFDRDCD